MKGRLSDRVGGLVLCAANAYVKVVRGFSESR